MSEMDLHESSEDADASGGQEFDVTVEAPEADALEQQAEVRLREGEPRGDAPPDVDPADRAEQSRIVELDEDDYR